MKNQSRIYFVTMLTFRSWFGLIFPQVAMSKSFPWTGWGMCFVFEASRPGWWFAKATAWMVGVNLVMFDYRLVDIHLPDGELALHRVEYQELAEIQQAVLQRWVSLLPSEMPDGNPYIEMFVRKQVSAELYRPLMMVRVAIWKAQSEGASTPVMFLVLRAGAEEVARFASEMGVRVISTTAGRIQANIRGFVIQACKAFTSRGLSIARKWIAAQWGQAPRGAGPETHRSASAEKARLGVMYVGRFNLDDPGKYSDLFFWQCSNLFAEDIILMFGYPQDPLDEEKLAQLEKHGLGAAVLNKSAVSTPRARVLPLAMRLHSPRASPSLARGPETSCSRAERRWLSQQEINYRQMVQYHLDLFNTTGVRMFVSYHKWDGNHAAIAEALERLGGILVLYQRSFETNPAAQFAVVTDILFGCSRFAAEIERQSGSIIRYHVVTGYVGDHRKSYVFPRAQSLRQQLMNHGAKRILAFFDEGSLDDSRWHTGHEHFRADYEFLLRQFFQDPSLGLVFKPKNLRMTRENLGSIGEMLRRAEMTGRCIVLGSGRMQSTTPPIEAGLVADVTVGKLCPGTASLECALGGVPSLLIDREGFPRSPLYNLGLGKVVFKDWDTLWRACQEHWRSEGGVPGFGDWSPMLDELDPFRDGRAAERMGTYVQWLIEGLKAGLDRDTVMADAAERYCTMWGKDKVTKIDGRT